MRVNKATVATNVSSVAGPTGDPDTDDGTAPHTMLSVPGCGAEAPLFCYIDSTLARARS